MSLHLNKFKKKFLAFSSIVIGLLLVICVLIPSLRPFFLNALKQPLKLAVFCRRELGGIVSYHRNLTQNERLRKEVDLLRNRLSTGLEVYLENERLKNLLSLKQASPYRLMAARVIGRSPDNWSCSIIIDKGKNSGIRDGMAAVNFLGLVGRVIEAGKYTSKILLLNDPGLGVSGLIQRSRQEGLVCGTLGAHLLMKYLPEESDIKVQDAVITSGLNSAYPKGLLIGKVIDIGKEFSGIGRFAIIKPAVNMSNIEEVLIIIE